jgi:UDP-glucose 4-epimerase
MKKVLITGVGGLIGKNLIPLLKDEHELFGITRKTAGTPGYKALQMDLSGNWNEDALPSKVDAVVHLAQSEHFREFPEFAEEVFSVNTLSTLRLLNYARKAGASTFILASSGGIYGTGNEEFSEDIAIPYRGDLGFYLGTKLCSEVIAESYIPFMNIVILRFFFVYGPGQRTSMLIPRLISSVMSGSPITLQGEDGIRINPIYVGDSVRLIKKALTLQKSTKINVAGREAFSLREIAGVMGARTGRKPVFKIEDAPAKNLVADTKKMISLLGTPEISLEKGIELTIHDMYPVLSGN